VLLARLQAAGVACNYVLTAYQYAPGYSQVQCDRYGSATPPPGPRDLVWLRVYDSAEEKAQDLEYLHSRHLVVLVGSNWTALPNADFPLPLLRAALGGEASG
jgi:hypothetical protein